MRIACKIPDVRAPILPYRVSESHHPCVPAVGSVNHLVLSLNSIQNIPPLSKSEEGADAPALGGLAHIKSLTLSSNNLRGWADINALAGHCPMLETLNITGNPITEGRSHSHILCVDPILTPVMGSQKNTVELSLLQSSPFSSP